MRVFGYLDVQLRLPARQRAVRRPPAPSTSVRRRGRCARGPGEERENGRGDGAGSDSEADRDVRLEHGRAVQGRPPRRCAEAGVEVPGSPGWVSEGRAWEFVTIPSKNWTASRHGGRTVSGGASGSRAVFGGRGRAAG